MAKLLTFEAKRLCSRIYQINTAFAQCGKNLSVARLGGAVQMPNDYFIVHNHILGHVVIFPEDVAEDDNVLIQGVVD